MRPAAAEEARRQTMHIFGGANEELGRRVVVVVVGIGALLVVHVATRVRQLPNPVRVWYF